MLVIARPGRERDVERVFTRWELHGVRIGETSAEPRLEIVSAGDIVASLEPRWLADDAPEYDVTEWAKAPSAAESEAESALARSRKGPNVLDDRKLTRADQNDPLDGRREAWAPPEDTSPAPTSPSPVSRGGAPTHK